nr:MAG TPA_asm: hypothetical protein [Caudoviricetes sp.]
MFSTALCNPSFLTNLPNKNISGFPLHLNILYSIFSD